jgi:hypothetical protein
MQLIVRFTPCRAWNEGDQDLVRLFTFRFRSLSLLISPSVADSVRFGDDRSDGNSDVGDEAGTRAERTVRLRIECYETSGAAPTPAPINDVAKY